MMIKLPEFRKLIYRKANSKNIVQQIVAKQQNVIADQLNSTKQGLSIIANGKSYFISRQKELIPENTHYALQAKNKPTVERLQAGDLSLQWVKHPLDNHPSVSEVVNSWRGAFSYLEEDADHDIKGLRQPQIGALHMILGHLKMPTETATVVLPTGTGKTETMLSVLIANRCKCLLVIVPSDSLRAQIAEKFLTLGLLKNFGVVSEAALYPKVGILRQGFSSAEDLQEFLSECNVVISTINVLTGLSEPMKEILVNVIDQVFIDEAHHVKANTWDNFKNIFPPERVIQFTATPFRNDGKRLDGKIIFNFPLREAQRQGYFTSIDFIPIREFDPEKADREIANAAILKLRQNLENGLNHILMARCATKERADRIFSLYSAETDLNPVVIYSGSTDFTQVYQKIIAKETRIIVCVDMLGEGFDLPELKIAAFHDIRKSLPITLQLAGRFTRTRHDQELGHASFIANIADLDVREELADLYSRDADWNQLLSEFSYGRVEDEVEYKSLMEGFSKLNDAKIPFQNIRVKLSAVVYKNRTDIWSPSNFKNGISNYDDLIFKFDDLNRDENILVIITAKRHDVDWVNLKEIYQVSWDITVVYWETRNNLLFINSSDNSILYNELAEAIIGEGAELIRGIDVFKTFYNVKRISLQNVGLRYLLGKSIRFRMMFGNDVGEALNMAETQKGEKAFVIGGGFEEGSPVNIGASYKGRIWAKEDGDLKDFKNWCTKLGSKLIDTNIDPNQILKETLIPRQISELPSVYPIWIDWDAEIYASAETKFRFNISGIQYDLSSLNLLIVEPDLQGSIRFIIKSEDREAKFELSLFKTTRDEDTYADFSITQLSNQTVTVSYGTRTETAIDFFKRYVPTIWFADGSALSGNDYVELRQAIGIYPAGNILTWDWSGVDLNVESQGVLPILQNSIQYKVIQELRTMDFDLIYDDDYSGEIGDVIAMKLHEDRLTVNIYHLKFAIGGVVSNQIKNLYEVCGQAQKSIHWKHKSGAEFVNHLLRRKTKTKNGNSRSRIEKGTEREIEKLLLIAKREIPIEFEIYIVQPGISKANVTTEMLTLLGVTENYIKEVSGINLKVIGSA